MVRSGSEAIIFSMASMSVATDATFRSRDPRGLVAWQTGNHSEAVGIDEGKTLRFIGKAVAQTLGSDLSFSPPDIEAKTER